ncbi:MAG: hypothetical protein V4732_12750 [Pseudomonadota bacterium]
MRKILFYLTGFILLQSPTPLLAGNLGINVILSGQVGPGVYGEVELHNAPRPRVVYEQPVVIVQDRRYIREEPIYLHVPPDHTRRWSHHCRSYNACGRRVYFVKSREYEPQYQRYERERRYYDTHPRKHHPDDHKHGHNGHDHNRHDRDRHDHDRHDRDRHDKDRHDRDRHDKDRHRDDNKRDHDRKNDHDGKRDHNGRH